MDFRTILVVLLGGLIAAASSGAGCSAISESDSNGDVDTLIADVDSIEVPTHISSSDTLPVTLYGRVGPNGCYSFDRFEVKRSPGTLLLRPMVRHRTGDDLVCTMAIVPLEETYRAPPPFSEETWTITVPQPDGEDVSSTVEVTSNNG